jgi:serine/threonine-protein kinase
LARPAAIKLIRPAVEGAGPARISEEARRRFEREAQATASLRSPHTVNLLDFGVAADGSFYYVMELLDGVDLNTLIQQYGPIPVERAIYLLQQVCHSLSEAEAIGLVHRDIKPANIFVCRYGEDCDFAKVLDFGLVKGVHDAADAGPDLTRENDIRGTPAFIAPEQARGDAVLDGRTDIYALGCVAYWLVTGQTVFTASTPMGLIVEHARTQPVAPSMRTELPIPPDFDAVVLACLAKDPAERPQSARQLSQRLEAIAVEHAWTEERRRAWWASHRPVAA